MLNTLVTQTSLYWSVLFLDQRPEYLGKFQWEMIFPKEIKVTMYSLELIQSVVEDPFEFG